MLPQRGDAEESCLRAWTQGQVEQQMLKSTAGDSGVSAEQLVGVWGCPRGRCSGCLPQYRGLRMDWLGWAAGYPSKGGEWW